MPTRSTRVRRRRNVAAFVGQQNFFEGTVVEGGAAVSTAHGIVRSADARLTGVASGEAAVRPENIRISADTGTEASDVNSVHGHLIGVSHLGDTMQYLVRLGDEQSLIVRRPTPDAPKLAVGDAVACEWQSAHVLLFPRDDSAEQGGYIPPPTA